MIEDSAVIEFRDGRGRAFWQPSVRQSVLVRDHDQYGSWKLWTERGGYEPVLFRSRRRAERVARREARRRARALGRRVERVA